MVTLLEPCGEVLEQPRGSALRLVRRHTQRDAPKLGQRSALFRREKKPSSSCFDAYASAPNRRSTSPSRPRPPSSRTGGPEHATRSRRWSSRVRPPSHTTASSRTRPSVPAGGRRGGCKPLIRRPERPGLPARARGRVVKRLPNGDIRRLRDGATNEVVASSRDHAHLRVSNTMERPATSTRGTDSIE